MEIALSNGKDHVYQWDKDIIVTVPENVPVVHFAWGNQAVGFEVENRQVTIPPELMQVSRPIRLWTYGEDHTIDDADIKVYPKPKPSDYIYTPTEIRTWEQLDTRIKALEDGGIVSGVSSVNGKSGAVELTAKDVGAATTQDVTSAVNAAAETLQPKGNYIEQDELQSATDAALKQAKESGEFDGDTGPQGPKGDTGDTGPQGPAGADGTPGKDGTDGKPINWRGGYSESTQYTKLDAVSYEGSSYIFASDTPTIGAVPGIDAEWELMAQKGDTGSQGPAGAGLDVTGATVGQIPVITAVDSNGKPTAWGSADMPGGTDLNAVNVFVADFAHDAMTVTSGAVDKYSRVVVS